MVDGKLSTGNAAASAKEHFCHSDRSEESRRLLGFFAAIRRTITFFSWNAFIGTKEVTDG
jgi:hypothetical protein